MCGKMYYQSNKRSGDGPINDFFEKRGCAKKQAERLLHYLERECGQKVRNKDNDIDQDVLETITNMFFRGAKAFEQRKRVLENT